MRILLPTAKDIQAALFRFEQDKARYLHMCEFVAETCRNDIVDRHAIHAEVTFRMKSPASLRRKLEQVYGQAHSAPDPISDPEDLLSGIDDIAAVRIAAWSEAGLERLLDLVRNRFSGVQTIRPAYKKIDKAEVAADNFYRAIHVEVCLPERDLREDNARLRGVMCEIQICSMLGHVWNEIEHHVRYKDGGVHPSSEEIGLLTELGQLVRHGDRLISRLSDARRARS